MCTSGRCTSRSIDSINCLQLRASRDSTQFSSARAKAQVDAAGWRETASGSETALATLRWRRVLLRHLWRPRARVFLLVYGFFSSPLALLVPLYKGTPFATSPTCTWLSFSLVSLCCVALSLSRTTRLSFSLHLLALSRRSLALSFLGHLQVPISRFVSIRLASTLIFSPLLASSLFRTSTPSFFSNRCRVKEHRCRAILSPCLGAGNLATKGQFILRPRPRPHIDKNENVLILIKMILILRAGAGEVWSLFERRGCTRARAKYKLALRKLCTRIRTCSVQWVIGKASEWGGNVPPDQKIC